MSTGRHARKRAAQKQEDYMVEQQNLANKAEAEEKERRKQLESQRIATMRARFGGQAPDVVSDKDEGNAQKRLSEGMGGVSKSDLPSKAKNRDPMRDTLMSMYLDEANGSRQGMDKKGRQGIMG